MSTENLVNINYMRSFIVLIVIGVTLTNVVLAQCSECTIDPEYPATSDLINLGPNILPDAYNSTPYSAQISLSDVEFDTEVQLHLNPPPGTSNVSAEGPQIVIRNSNSVSAVH